MALTVRAMTDKGIKITGMSGQAKLKVRSKDIAIDIAICPL